jgi:hypothetical protein
MQAPPFRLARTAGAEQTDAYAGDRMRVADACCAPSKAQLNSLKRRTRLAELDAHLHCSIIGTCLTTHELRKLVPKFTHLDRQKASDLEIHHAAVELAIEGGAGGKALQKALDERYAGALRRFDTAKDPDAVLALWNDALKNGDIPPAYWALMTHSHTTMPVRQAAFGQLNILKRVCERSQVAYYPLRTASVASFVELVTRVYADAKPASAPVSRFCLRHG